MPFALIPTTMALAVSVIEYAAHTNDLRWALADEVPYPADAAGVFIRLMAPFLSMLAAAPAAEPPPAGGVRLRLRSTSSGASFVLAGSGAGWGVDDGDASCEIAGDDSALSLLALGRITPDHPWLITSGERRQADWFKRWFPGP